MFSNLERELQRQSSLPSKNKKQIIKIQNDNLKDIKDYFRKEAAKLNKRGPPIPMPNKVLTSEQIAEIEANAQRNLKRFFDIRKRGSTSSDRVSSGVSINDKGYDGISDRVKSGVSMNDKGYDGDIIGKRFKKEKNW